MFKYFITFIGLPILVHAQDAKTTYYAAPYLKIQDVNKKVAIESNDFGYNTLVHNHDVFLKEGYYMWVDDQWYQVLNAKDIFTSYLDFKTLFTISDENKKPLQIKDVNDVEFLFPIEALDTYKVSYNDFNLLSASIQKQNVTLYSKPDVEKLALEEIVFVDTKPDLLIDGNTVIVETNTAEEEIINVKSEIATETNTTTVETKPIVKEKEEVMITSEDPSSILLDVIDIVEVVKREEIPFDPMKKEVPSEDISLEEKPVDVIVAPEKEVKISATNTLIIANPQNDYEIAVNEGFDGTVTEWIESINEKGGKTAYQQAVDKGYVGSEEDWMKMLWGRQVDVEIAKKDKTAAIVTEWIQSLKSTKGVSPYELALKHGFYGTYTEWVESVVGVDGEKAYEHAKTKGFEGSYKDWIEAQLNSSNKEMLRKERLTKTQMFVAPNVMLPINNVEADQALSFDLFEYYNQYYGAPMVSSNGESSDAIELNATDLEYQITWFEKDKIKIIELSKDGILKYIPLITEGVLSSKLNVRYILK